MSGILAKHSLLLLVSYILISCGDRTSSQAKIIKIVNEAAAVQAEKPAPAQNPENRDENIHAMMTSATKYTSCIESLAERKKLSPKEAASLMGLGDNSQVKLDPGVESDIRMIKVYDAVTNKFCQ